ncbi:hypothetical protein V2J09_017399 [Rumex salicifolius]
MADAALFGIAKSILKQLGSPAMEEIKLLWNHNTQLKYLEKTITTISNVLQDAERQQESNATVKEWLERLKVVLYDADDFFDTVSAKALQHKAKYGRGKKMVARLPFSKMYHFAFVVKSAHKVKDIRERIDAIAKDIKDFNFLVSTIGRDHPERTRRDATHSYVPSKEVVGREQEKEDIVKMLLTPPAEREGVYVIAVIGIGGLGKTTVAQFVYGDNRIERDFDLRMWACINDFSCLDQVLVTLVESITEEKVEALATEILQSKLRKEIEGKRFLLVLDDVWDEHPQRWHKLKILLDSGKPGSMVLATTRSVQVAQTLSAVEPYYHLQGISDESAWILFKKMAFGWKHPNSRLEVLGQQIVKKCANVPLLILTIASFLRYKEESKWCSLVDGEFPTVVPGDYTKVMQVLKVSYREFPYPVKRCFAFCSLFPKDYDFDKDELIRLWVAEGFIEADDVGQSLEDKAEEYFFYLADRCFFQNVMRPEDYIWCTNYGCRMHDLVHDLAQEVAGSESISVDDICAQKLETRDRNLRHVSLLGREWSHIPHPNSVRTFLQFHGGYKGANDFLNKQMSNFKALRVLDLSRMGIKEIPASIGKLTHLRLLDLSHNYMERLPSSICSLLHLQALILRYCSDLKELPEEIGRLISLRHLILKGCKMSSDTMSAGLAALTSLVTLDKQVVHKPGGDLRYLECLNNLSGSLRIWIHGTEWEDVVVDAQRASLSKKSGLKEIIMKFKKVESGGQVEVLMGALEPHPNLEFLDIKGFRGNKMPRWFTCLDRLVVLELNSCKRVVELPPVSRLRSLKMLNLESMPSLLAIEDNISHDPEFVFFPSLELLYVHDMPNLRGWWVQEPAVLPKFSSVTKVEIIGCQKLEIECMPLFEPVVEYLQLEGVQQEVVWGIGNGCAGALKSLSICNIRGLTKMETRHLPSLERLYINDCAELETVCLAHLTALDSLSIKNCGKLGEDKAGVSWGHLPVLRRLIISNVTRDTFKGFNEGAVQWQLLQRLKAMQLSFKGTSCTRGHLDGFEHLTNSLEELRLRDCTDLYLPWTSLEELISNVERVIDVGSTPTQREIQQQLIISTSLRYMSIGGGSAESVLGMPWMSFPSLRDLILKDISNLEALPEGIKHLSSLQTLRLINCKQVMSLPCWINSLSSLRTLNFRGCSEELEKRCQEPTGEDWPLIQHLEWVHF